MIFRILIPDYPFMNPFMNEGVTTIFISISIIIFTLNLIITIILLKKTKVIKSSNFKEELIIIGIFIFHFILYIFVLIIEQKQFSIFSLLTFNYVLLSIYSFIYLTIAIYYCFRSRGYKE